MTVETNKDNEVADNNKELEAVEELNKLKAEFNELKSLVNKPATEEIKTETPKYTDEILQRIEMEKKLKNEAHIQIQMADKNFKFKEKLGKIASRVGEDGEKFFKDYEPIYDEYPTDSINSKVLVGLSELVFNNEKNRDFIPKIFKEDAVNFIKSVGNKEITFEERHKMAEKLMPALDIALENIEKQQMLSQSNRIPDYHKKDQIQQLLSAHKGKKND